MLRHAVPPPQPGFKNFITTCSLEGSGTVDGLSRVFYIESLSSSIVAAAVSEAVCVVCLGQLATIFLASLSKIPSCSRILDAP